MPLDFANRTFVPQVLRDFRAAFDAYAAKSTPQASEKYAEYFRYHHIMDTDMAGHAAHFGQYVDEVVRQLSAEPALVTKCGGAWLYLKDLAEDLLDSGDASLEKKAKELADAIGQATGENVMPSGYKDVGGITAQEGQVSESIRPLFETMLRMSAAFFQSPGQFKELMDELKRGLAKAKPSDRAELTLAALSHCKTSNNPADAWGLGLLLEGADAGCAPQVSALLEHKVFEIREPALKYLGRIQVPGVEVKLIALHKREKSSGNKQLIAAALEFQGAKSPEAKAVIDKVRKPPSGRPGMLKPSISLPAEESFWDKIRRMMGLKK